MADLFCEMAIHLEGGCCEITFLGFKQIYTFCRDIILQSQLRGVQELSYKKKQKTKQKQHLKQEKLLKLQSMVYRLFSGLLQSERFDTPMEKATVE